MEILHRLTDSPSKIVFKKTPEAKIATREESMFVRMLMIQWNLSNTMPEDMNKLIPNKGRGMDLIILGLQESTYSFKDVQDEDSDDDEMVDPPPAPLSRQESKRSKRSLFHEISSRRKSLKDALEPSYNHMIYLIEQVIASDFYLVKHVRRSKMQLIIYARHAIKYAIREVRSSKENTGFLYVFPNKGGLCVSLSIGQTSFTFISCHLTAQDGPAKCAQRNDSIEEILKGARFGDKCYDPTLLAHHAFILGDLNYRITFDPRTPTPRSQRKPSFLASSGYSFLSSDQQISEVLQMIEREQWEELLRHDELAREMAAGRALSGFTSLAPQFPPTYKRYRGKAIDKYFGSKADSIAATAESAAEIHPLTHFRCRSELPRGSHTPPPNHSRKLFLDRNWGVDLMRRSLQTYKQKAFDRSLQRNLKGNSALLKDISVSRETDPAPIDVLSVKVSEDDRDAGLLRGSESSEFYVTSRVPSYTDRILLKSLPRFSTPEHVKVLFFESCEAVVTSDHKPVRACFEVTVDAGVYGIMVPKTAKGFAMASRLTLPSADLLRMRYTSVNRSFSIPLPNYLRVRISELMAMDLTARESADPYVTIAADPPQILRKTGRNSLSTSFESRTCNPVWREETIDFDICTVDLRGLSNHAHLIVSVFDHNKSKPSGLIGAVVISMKEIIDAHLLTDRGFEFSKDLHNNALKQGEISGVIKLIPSSDDKDSPLNGISIADFFQMDPRLLQMTPEYNFGSTYQKTKSDSTFLLGDGDENYIDFPWCPCGDRHSFS